MNKEKQRAKFKRGEEIFTEAPRISASLSDRLM
jgi:hypothetical protein